jgi:hypothetical protein
MAQTKKPIPKSQIELSQETITPYTNQGKAPIPTNKKRENQRTVKGDDVKMFSVGIRDFDQAIVYYFNNVIRPSVIQNGTKINVPFIYGSPEKWAAVQRDGYYRDNNGKIQTPLIMFKRDSLEKNRTLGNKLDANLPSNFGIFEKKYSKKNFYDRFSVLTNRIPVKEYYGVIIPDYVNIVYSCTIFTEYVDQMNKIIESINFSSDSYWGDPERFKFRAAIDTYNTVTEQVQGEDRTVKTTFQIKLAGYIVSDAINTSVANPNKYYSKAAVKFSMETAGSTEILNTRAGTPEKAAPTRFFDTALTGVSGGGTSSGGSGMTAEQIAYVGMSSTALADVVTTSLATFNSKLIATPPTGFALLDEGDFQVYINGVLVPTGNRTTTQSGSNITVTFSSLGFTLDSSDQVLLVGKFSSI